MSSNWRSIEGNEKVFHRLCDVVKGGDAIAFVGAGASVGLYPLWGDLIRELADEAVSKGAKPADRDYWLTNFHSSPDIVGTGIKHAVPPGTFGEILYRIFRRKVGPDGKPFTPLHGDLIKLPFRGYITTNFDPGLIEARLSLRPDSGSTGFATWRDRAVERWYNGEIFRDQLCPVLFAHGFYERSDTIVLALDDYREAYGNGPFRRLFESIWQQKHIVFVGYGFADPWIKAVANVGLLNGAHAVAARHIALMGLIPEMEYSAQMRRAAHDQFGAEALIYPIVRLSEQREDHEALRSILGEVASNLGNGARASTGKNKATPHVQQPEATVAPANIKYRFVHETTEDKHFTGRSDDLRRLDRWAADPEVRVITITGIGGLGKTSLVAHWIKNNAATLRRAKPVRGIFFWSIYSDRDVKHLFEAFTRFAIDELKVAAPQGPLDVAAAALELLRSTPMLLVIDGLELLQEMSPSLGSGALLRGEVRELIFRACQLKHDSLVLLTSRFPFADLMPFLGQGLRDLPLENLSPREGAALLATCDVGGTHSEREGASRQLEGHPLGLRLLALAHAQHGGDPNLLIQKILGTSALAKEAQSTKLKHLLEFYEQKMPRIQVALIGIVSFFRSPAPTQKILDLALRLPAVATETAGWSPAQLEDVLRTLSLQHLLIGDAAGNAWSCHPILRDHFRHSLLRWDCSNKGALGVDEECSETAEGVARESEGRSRDRNIAVRAAEILIGSEMEELIGSKTRPIPAIDQPQSIRALEPLLIAIELLLEANDFFSADQLFLKRLKKGRIFRQLAAPSEGMRCAMGFVSDLERRRRCETDLQNPKESIAAYVNTIGVCARETGEFLLGTKYLDECTRIYREGNNATELSTSLQNWAGLLIILGRLGEAQTRADEAVAAAKAAHANQELRGAYSYLGAVLGKRGKIGAARKAFMEATKLEHLVSQSRRPSVRAAAGASDERWNVEGLFSRRGIRFADLLLRIGDVDEAQSLMKANLQFCAKKKWQEETARCLSVLGEIELSRLNIEAADAPLEVAEKIFRDGNTLSQLPRVLLARSELERLRRNWERASEAVDEALTLAAPRQMRLDQADALLLRSRLALQQAKEEAADATAAETASDDAEAARLIARQCDYAWAERDALVQLAQSYSFLGEDDRAISFARDAGVLSARLADRTEPLAEPA